MFLTQSELFVDRYWLLRSLKDPIVATIVGVEYIPKCKMLSLVVVFTLVCQSEFCNRGRWIHML